MNEKELDKLIGIIRKDNLFYEATTALDKIEVQFKSYISSVEPIKTTMDKSGTHHVKLYKIAHELKQKDDEHWAVGEMLERTMILFSALDYENGEYIGNKK